MHTLVIGGGLVGLATAHKLLELGDQVTILEKHRVGSGASRGNAGQVCPELSTPVAKASLIKSAVTHAYRKDSALHVDPLSIPTYAKFLMQIAWNALPKHYSANQAALRNIGVEATEAFNNLASKLGIRPNQSGYLHLYDDAESAKIGRDAVNAKYAGSPFEHSTSEVKPANEIEPSIREGSFGFLYKGSSFIDPNELVDSLWEACSRSGAEIIENVPVVRISEPPGGVVVHTSSGDVHGDRAVICAGAESRRIAASLGTKLPLMAGKGYSFTFHPEPAPRYVIKFESAHAALLPMPNGTRIAGTMEFDIDYNKLNYNRIRQIVHAVEPYFDRDVLERRTNEWVGARPVTPDGLPLVGRLPRTKRTYIHSGHNMLGLMMAPYTAHVLATLLSPVAPTGIASLAPSRFNL